MACVDGFFVVVKLTFTLISLVLLALEDFSSSVFRSDSLHLVVQLNSSLHHITKPELETCFYASCGPQLFICLCRISSFNLNNKITSTWTNASFAPIIVLTNMNPPLPSFDPNSHCLFFAETLLPSGIPLFPSRNSISLCLLLLLKMWRLVLSDFMCVRGLE